MAVAARKAFFEPVRRRAARAARPAPRLAGETDRAGPSAVHAQQRRLEAAFTTRHDQPRFRAVTFSLLTLVSVGLWAAIIAAVVHVGRMIHP